MRARPYPRTKPSGVEWLGDVPEHWDVLAVKRRFRIVNGGTPSSSEDTYWEGDIPWFTPEDLGRIETKVISTSRRRITKDGLANCGASLSPSGSVLVSTRAPIGHVAVMGVDGCCNQGCRILVPEGAKISTDFGFYAVLASKAVLNSVGKGTTFLELSAGALGAHFIPLPDSAEQRAIAAFLDRETGRVDRLVAKKRELIERLKEKRTALISRTVTRGLPPAAARAAGLTENPAFTPSGVEWLGEIPKHWSVTRLKYAAARIVDCPHETPVYSEDGEFAVVRTADLILGALRLESVYRVDPEEYRRRIRRETVLPGDVLYGREGERWGFAATAPASPLVCLGQRMMQFRAAAHYSACFLMWQLNGRSVYEQGAVDTMGSTAPHVNVETIRNYWLTEPPLPEQAAIAAYLDEETAKLDALVGKVEEAVERLQEYRTALITAAVSGKIDVRPKSETATLTP